MLRSFKVVRHRFKRLRTTAVRWEVRLSTYRPHRQNADIEIDGNFIGNTPSSLGLASGEHTVKITKSGYTPWQRKITTSTGAAKLAPELEIASPATVAPTITEPTTIETKRTSPVLVKTAAPAAELVSPSAPVPPRSASATTEVAHGTAESTGTRGTRPGSVSVTTTPDGAEIYVDSIGHGKAPSRFNLAPGSHTVQVVMSGYKDWTSNVMVNSDSVVNVTANLEK
jgi:hypothetical protein